MASFLHSISSVCIILLLTATGYFCAVKGWMGPQTKAFLSKYLLSFAVPATCIHGLTSNLNRDMIRSAGKALILLTILDLLLVGLSFLAAKALKLPRKQLGVFIMMCSVSNAIFVGYSMCRELFGEECVVYVMLYYLINTTFVQFMGSSLIRWGGGGEFGFSAKTLISFLKTPSVLAVIVSFLIILFDISLPSLFMTYIGYLDKTVTPMALVLTGYIIYDIGLKNLRISKPVLVMLVFRFILSPAVCIFGCAAIGITGFARNIFAVEAAMPVVTQTVVFASEYGADEKLAAQGAAISTIGCFVEIPILMLLLG